LKMILWAIWESKWDAHPVMLI